MIDSIGVDSNPNSGIYQFPHTGVKYRHSSRMGPRDVLATNLKKLMATAPGRSTLPEIVKAGGGSNGTLDRIRRKKVAPTIDKLEPLANAFGLEPWQLLVPSLTVEYSKSGRPRLIGAPEPRKFLLPPKPPTEAVFSFCQTHPICGNTPELLSESHIWACNIPFVGLQSLHHPPAQQSSRSLRGDGEIGATS